MLIGVGRVLLLTMAMGCAAAPALADVLDVGDDGVVTHMNAPAIVYSSDLRAVAPLRASATRPRGAPVGMAGQIVPIRTIIAEAAQQNQLHPALVEAVAWQESHLHQGAVSSKGAIGVMQLMPATASALRVDPRDPVANIQGGARYLGWLVQRYQGNLVKVLAAYNAGAGAVDRYGGVPPYAETRAYVAAVLDRLASPAMMAPVDK